MNERSKKLAKSDECGAKTEDAFDLNALLNPAYAFAHPSDVVGDPDLTLNEKRAILASWASDACAIEATPLLRRGPGGKKPIPFDDVIEALKTLDKQAQQSTARHYRTLRRDRVLGKRLNSPDGSAGHGPTLS